MCEPLADWITHSRGLRTEDIMVFISSQALSELTQSCSTQPQNQVSSLFLPQPSLDRMKADRNKK